jgi:hypothetical protein
MLVINSIDLNYDRANISFSADASYLEEKYPITRLDYEDGMWCLRIKSHKTQKIVKFIRSQEHYNSEGKLNYVIFRGENNLASVTLKIYND